MGGDNADLLFGGAGNDTISGGTGDDHILGGAGNDSLTLGTGSDILDLVNGDGQDTVTDFNMTLVSGKTTDQLNVADLLDLNGNPVRVNDVVVTDDGFGNARLTFPNGESVVLDGISPASVNSYAALHSMGIPCFVTGTRIKVPEGDALVEDLRPGDLVETLDHGAQPLKWVGSKVMTPQELKDAAKMRPVRIKAGTLGATSDLWVSQQHRMLVTLKGHEVLVRAIHLAQAAMRGVRVAQGRRQVRYHHLLFAQHEVNIANGALTESFYPGRIGLRALAPMARLEILSQLPGIGSGILSGADPSEYFGPTARREVVRRDLEIQELGIAWRFPERSQAQLGPRQ
ncbi:Hint domain-containing protein [Rhodobacter sp. KR11]|uniref:Hint domain-containing protein n=1 Tax=Rhodobacter sp. KR11 TaxID=2974588 RepID=UPI002222B632|nr:Hint domain-containing protein [Rhodobacter sp. KR11]MCW1918051.1 Hint domain-containing protein [Rhodobacter sp. KR11]